eukprot:scaffold12477_cov119-Isochrysis_galbana.AAC.4
MPAEMGSAGSKSMRRRCSRHGAGGTPVRLATPAPATYHPARPTRPALPPLPRAPPPLPPDPPPAPRPPSAGLPEAERRWARSLRQGWAAQAAPPPTAPPGAPRPRLPPGRAARACPTRRRRTEVGWLHRRCGNVQRPIAAGVAGGGPGAGGGGARRGPRPPDAAGAPEATPGIARYRRGEPRAPRGAAPARTRRWQRSSQGSKPRHRPKPHHHPWRRQPRRARALPHRAHRSLRAPRYPPRPPAHAPKIEAPARRRPQPPPQPRRRFDRSRCYSTRRHRSVLHRRPRCQPQSRAAPVPRGRTPSVAAAARRTRLLGRARADAGSAAAALPPPPCRDASPAAN